MQQKVYILVTEQNKDIVPNIRTGTKVYLNPYDTDKMVLSESLLHKLAGMCSTEYFYVILTTTEVHFSTYAFDFTPPIWDSKYMHTWNNDNTVRLFCKNHILDKPWEFSDESLTAGNVQIKNHAGKLYDIPLSDIVFISYDETYADENYASLIKRFPRTRRIQGVKGICEAHIAAANIVETDMFFVVDADAVITPDFDFTFQPSEYDRDSVHVWHSKNVINDLEYGYGGVKLFPSKELKDYKDSPLDFTTSVSNNFKVIPAVSNITRFNTDPFAAWRSGFREGVKLASKTDTESILRLNTWCTVGADRDFGDFAIMGANEGKDYGIQNADKPEILGLINNFSWLEHKFSN